MKFINILFYIILFFTSISAQTITSEYMGEWVSVNVNVSEIQVSPVFFDGYGNRVAWFQTVKMDSWYGNRSGYRWIFVNGFYQWQWHTDTRWWYKYYPVGLRYIKRVW